MIFRRRRTRIEIEQTTVKVKANDRSSVVVRPLAVTPVPSPSESILGRVLPFSAPEPTEANAQPAVTTIHKPTAKETRP
jgi:hypothetical protein